jgi:phosphohistidine phosphatase
MVVGHDPHLSQLATLLVTGRPEPLVFHLKKGSVVRLDRGPDVWTVRWLVSPEVA